MAVLSSLILFSLFSTIMVILASININGLCNNDKITKSMHMFKACHYDIVCIQEIFWSSDNVEKYSALFENDFYVFSNICSAPIGRRGVCCLISKKSGIVIQRVATDDEGRVIQLVCEIDDNIVNITNIYSPRVPKERSLFFDNLGKYNVNDAINILVGDFNCKMNPAKDNSRTVLANSDQSRKRLQQITNDYQYVDIWRNHHPNSLQFTWRRYDSINHILFQSRIDYIFMNTDSLHHCISSDIVRYPYSDHDVVKCNFNFESVARGPGIWKFNNSLLDDEVYNFETRQIIVNSKENRNFKVNKFDWRGT